jgi:hypothetical protein
MPVEKPLLRAIVLTALNDSDGRAAALSNADAAGAQIGLEKLKEQYAAERAQLSFTAEVSRSSIHAVK